MSSTNKIANSSTALKLLLVTGSKDLCSFLHSSADLQLSEIELCSMHHKIVTSTAINIIEEKIAVLRQQLSNNS